MRRVISVVVLGLVLTSCGSSSNGAATATTELGPIPVSSSVRTEAATTTVVETTSTTSTVAPASGRTTVEMPSPQDACGRIEAAVTAFSPNALGQDEPALVPGTDGDGSECAMRWQEQPPNSALLRATLLFASTETMGTEIERDGYSCDPTPDVVPGWAQAFTCDRTSADGPAVLIWLDLDGQSISLSFRGRFTGGMTPEDVVDALEVVLGPNGIVITPPPPPSTILVAPLPTVGSTIATLPPKVWDGTYVAEPRSGPLQIGDRGQRVTELQRNLGLHGLLDPPYDGYFGRDTEQAVMDFQREQGLLPIDGIASDAVLEVLQYG
jgi:hypothetical protein